MKKRRSVSILLALVLVAAMLFSAPVSAGGNYKSDPEVDVLCNPDRTIVTLVKDLTGMAQYGGNGADILYTGENSTYTFHIPDSIPISSIAGAYMGYVVAADDVTAISESKYKLNINGYDSDLYLLHGTPYGGPFTNWVTGRFNLDAARDVKITITNISDTGPANWIGIDKLELVLTMKTSLPEPVKSGMQINASNERGLIRLDWTTGNNPVSGEVPLGYNVFRASDLKAFGLKPLNASPLKDMKYIDQDVVKGKRYFYKIVPLYASNVGAVLTDTTGMETFDAINGVYTAYNTNVICATYRGFGNADCSNIVLSIGNPVMRVDGIDREIDPGRGTKPILLGGRTMLPIRGVVEGFGGTVTWNADTQAITTRLPFFNLAYHEVDLWLNQKRIVTDNVEKSIDTAPVSINDRTMVPLRAVLENLGCTVDWYPDSQQIVIRHFYGFMSS